MIKNSQNEEISQSVIKIKREQYAHEIRKRKTDDFLNSKRFKLTENKENIEQSISEMAKVITITIIIIIWKFSSKVDFQDLAKSFLTNLSSKNFEILAGVLENIRRSISRTEDPPIKALVGTNICSFISELLDPRYAAFTKLQHEAAWVLTNIASGEKDDTAYVVKLGCIPRFVCLMRHSNEDVSEQVSSFLLLWL